MQYLIQLNIDLSDAVPDQSGPEFDWLLREELEDYFLREVQSERFQEALKRLGRRWQSILAKRN